MPIIVLLHLSIKGTCRHVNFILLVISQLFLINNLSSQSWQFFPDSLHQAGIVFTAFDSLYHARLPKLRAGNDLPEKDLPVLPYKHNNAKLPFFRPVFSQGSSASCGQASGIAYNFTYEINRARNQPANVPENQFPTHYHWNFSNGGHGWYGSSYFHSFEIVRTNGSPTIADYGGMDYGGNSRWMTGYDKYYSGMHHRIEGVYTIDVSNEEGLLTLKHWLYHHLEGSETGGVASFYASSPWDLKTLPQGTPDAGKKVVTYFQNPATHAMTIVGWNDSICWDYNGDGQYTNHIDLNGDGEINMLDWEKGGLIFANSYGQYWADSGFCYMMYRTLAESIFNGGIWNHAVHVLKVLPDYHPLVTAKITLKHPARGRIKVTMGISSNPQDQSPEFVMDYPIFNYHGSDLYMQGGTTPDQQIIELGLDISTLLQHVIPGQAAKYFLQVSEFDPLNLFHGEIISFSVIDYTSSTPIEYLFSGCPMPLINHATTTLGIECSINYQQIHILTFYLPPAQQHQTVICQLEASGGMQPYTWQRIFDYTEHSITYNPLLEASEQVLPAPAPLTWANVNLGFNFPFFDSVYQEVSIYPNGFIMFGDRPFPYPYWLDPMVFLKNFPVIGVMMSPDIKLANTSNGVFVNTSNEKLIVRWNVNYVFGTYLLPLSFGLILHNDGKVEFHYGPFESSIHFNWSGGISAGDRLNFHRLSLSERLKLASPCAMALAPTGITGNITLSKQGVLSYAFNDLHQIREIRVRVKDTRELTDTRIYQLTDGILFGFDVQQSLTPGKENQLDAWLKNTTSQHTGVISLIFDAPSASAVEWISSSLQFSGLAPGDSIYFNSVARFVLTSPLPEQSLIAIHGRFVTPARQREKTIYRTTQAAALAFSSVQILGTSGNTVFPGERYTLEVNVINSGMELAKNVRVAVISNDPYLILLPPLQTNPQNIAPQGGVRSFFGFSVHNKAMRGKKCQLQLYLYMDTLLIGKISMWLSIDSTRILSIDLDPRRTSIPRLNQALSQLGFSYDYSSGLLPLNLDAYDVVFVGLGSFPHRYPLSNTEGQVLYNYLVQGKAMYLEGGSTWRGDPKTAVHSLFNINGFTQGWPYGIDSLAGIEGTFAEGFAFKYAENQLKKTDNLQPVNGAFAIFKDIPRNFIYAVANHSDTCRAIGSSFLFGGLYKHITDTLPRQLLKKYLEFFQLIPHYKVVANFSADRYLVCQGDQVVFTPKCIGNNLGLLWEFQGGLPFSSTERQPVIKYLEPGVFPVRLIASDGNQADTLLLENLIVVESCSGIPDRELFSLHIYPNPASDWLSLCTFGKITQPVLIEIINLQGRSCFVKGPVILQPGSPLVYDISHLQPGLYIVSMKSQEAMKNIKLLIIR